MAYVSSVSNWGGRPGYRNATSGGVWMLGEHCIKTWGSTQGAVALSSAEAEFYGMVEAVIKSKGLHCLATELGFKDLSNVVNLNTDSSAAKSFVSRQGFGKMKHIEIRDMWLQKEVRDGRVVVQKIPGTQNPADLMTKILSTPEIMVRLSGMNVHGSFISGPIKDK